MSDNIEAPTSSSCPKPTPIGDEEKQTGKSLDPLRQTKTLNHPMVRRCRVFRRKISTVLSNVIRVFWFLIDPVFAPMLFLGILGARFLQLFSKSGDDFIKAVTLKYQFKLNLLVHALFCLIDMAIYYPIAKYAPVVKHLELLGLPLSKWLLIICMLCGLYILAFTVSIFIHAFLFSFIITSGPDHRTVNIAESLVDIANCLILYWGELYLVKAVRITQYDLLGLAVSQWIKVVTLAIIGYNSIKMSTHAIMWPLLNRLISFKAVEKLFKINAVSYFASGMRESIDFFLTSLMLLLIWVLYFGTHLKPTSKVIANGTEVCGCLVVCSLLWIVKTCIVLDWEARSIYSRQREKISEAGKQLYLLRLLLYDSKSKQYDDQYTGVKASTKQLVSHALSEFFGGMKHLFSQLHHTDLALPMSSKRASVYTLAKVAAYIRRAKDEFSKESFEEVNRCGLTKDDVKALIKDEHLHPDEEAELNEIVERLVTTEDNMLVTTEDKKILPDVQGTVEWEAELQTWKDEWVILANAIDNEMEIVKCLTNLFNSAIIAATILLWLLISNITSGKVLATILPPIAGFSFIFGETCKKWFESVVFIYAIRPFDVNDTCDIEGDEELVVVSIDVLKTTFFRRTKTSDGKPGEAVEVIYPNSVLAGQKIVNRKVKSSLGKMKEEGRGVQLVPIEQS